MSNKPRKTRKLPEYITRRELVVFARAVDARIAQEIAKAKAEMAPRFTEPNVPDIQGGGIIFDDGTVVEFEDGTVIHAPTDSEGAE